MWEGYGFLGYADLLCNENGIILGMNEGPRRMLYIEPNKYREVRVGIEKQILKGEWEWIYVARFHLVGRGPHWSLVSSIFIPSSFI